MNVREIRRSNQEWTIQTHKQHWIHTQKEGKQNTTQKTKQMNNMDSTIKPGGIRVVKCKQFLFLTRHTRATHIVKSVKSLVYDRGKE